jgi:hypothetical protein
VLSDLSTSLPRWREPERAVIPEGAFCPLPCMQEVGAVFRAR